MQSQQSTVKKPLLALTIPDDSQDAVGVTKCDDVEKLLVYPFIGGDRIELAAQGLDLCDFWSDYDDDRLITVQMEHLVGRNQFQTFHQKDFDRLNPRTCVNDVIIGFWSLWICQNDFPNTSNALTFLLHLDSAGLHSYNRIGSRIRKLLTYEWKQTKQDEEENILNDKALPIVCSSGKSFVFDFVLLCVILSNTNISYFFSWSVTQQNNGYDCGLFLCQFAYILYQNHLECGHTKTNFILTICFSSLKT